MRFTASDDPILVKPRKGKGRARSIATNGARFHQYGGAVTGRDRSPPRPLRSPDSPMAQSDALQMQRRAHDQGNDNAFIDYLVSQYRTYGWGDLQYIPNTGNRRSNQLYRDYWQEWMENANFATARSNLVPGARTYLSVKMRSPNVSARVALIK